MKRLELCVDGRGYARQRFVVPKNGLRLGRSSSNDIPIRDEELSRNHCLFEPIGEQGIRLTDLASANGTFVNEQRLGAESVELKAGDVIRVGSTSITVVDEAARVEYDLGLGAPTAKAKGEGEKKDEGRRRSPIFNVLCGVAVLALGVSLWLVMKTPSPQHNPTSEIVDETPELIEMRYEKVVGDSASIFRYYLSLAADGTLNVAIDDLSGEGRHVQRHAPLRDAAKARLLEILSDENFTSLDREYTGPEEDPPVLKSARIRYYTNLSRKSVSVTNTQEPDAFRRVREKLETFSMNELGIRAMQYTRETLLEMARTAGDTGLMKWEDRDVEYGNLHASIVAYREAIYDLETINPKPPEFETYRQQLERATQELDKRYRDQRFLVDQALSTGDWQKAKEELMKLREMIPDREDERNHKAELELTDVEKRLGKKGGK